MGMMESVSLVEQSVSADVSEFARAELEAFVALSRRLRPDAWSRVERLQRTCRLESPSTASGRQRSERVMAQMLFG